MKGATGGSPVTGNRPVTGSRVVKRVAITFVGVGVLLLSFVAYQLWGTALYEHSAQSHLRQELAGKVEGPGVGHFPVGLPLERPDRHHRPGDHVVDKVAPTTPDPSVNTPIGLLTIPASA